MRAIHNEAPHATFVRSESCEYLHPANPSLSDAAGFENEPRLIPPELTYGRIVSERMYRHLRQYGMAENEYQFFMDASESFDCILITDYYVTNEHLLYPDGSTGHSTEYFGYYV